jgi:hypothetical protein
MPRPCRAAKNSECVFLIWFTNCGRVWFTLAMPCPCYALTMPFFSRPQISTSVERRPVGYLPAFGFFRLPCGVPRRLLSDHTSLRCRWPVWNQTPFVMDEEKSGSSTQQKRRSVTLLDKQLGYFRLSCGHSRRARHCRSSAGARYCMAGERHGHGMLCVNRP